MRKMREGKAESVREVILRKEVDGERNLSFPFFILSNSENLASLWKAVCLWL